MRTAVEPSPVLIFLVMFLVHAAGYAQEHDLGSITRANIAAMMVPPAPRTAEIEGTNGELAVAAVRRVLTGKVKEPRGQDSIRAFDEQQGPGGAPAGQGGKAQ